MKHEKTKTEWRKKINKNTNATVHMIAIWSFWYTAWDICNAFAVSMPACLPACPTTTSSYFFFSLFTFFPYLGIFLKSAFLFDGFGINQISNNFSTPSKKCGLLIFSFSAIVWIRKFSILICFFFINRFFTKSSVFSRDYMFVCRSEKIF